MRHRRPDSQLEHGNGSGIQRSTSIRQPIAPSQLGRTSSMRIPANTAQGPYYQSMISSIQKSGTGIQPPTPKEIYGVYLDEEVAELKDWIKSFKRRVVFHKSVNASEKIQNVNYIESLMDTMVEEIGPQYVVQIITDNEVNFKKVSLQLMEKRKTLFWPPCATHCIDLMLKDIGELDAIKKCVA
uniref:DUF659 domain-containing protein n=1 Tax=Musa acuminata subsp. malaccensis TaxID=214687 RepID=A0A804HYV1_MUSAM